MLEDVFRDGLQVTDVIHVADVFSNGPDHHVAGRQDQLVGAYLRQNKQPITLLPSETSCLRRNVMGVTRVSIGTANDMRFKCKS